jgi:hypothetical protein
MGSWAMVAGRPDGMSTITGPVPEGAGGSVLIEEGNSSEISEVERKANGTQKKGERRWQPIGVLHGKTLISQLCLLLT